MSTNLQHRITPDREPGVYSMPFIDYVNAPGINKGLLDDFAECPQAALEAINIGRPEKETEPMVFGRLAHAWISEPKDFESMFYVHPEDYPSGDDMKPWTMRANYCKKWVADRSDRPVISSAELDEIVAVAEAIKAEPKAKPLFTGGKYEQSVFGIEEETGLPMKGRPDFIPDSGRFLVDFKFTNDASIEALTKSIVKMRYHVQAAIYWDLVTQAGLELSAFYFVFVQRGDRPRVNVRKLTQRGLDTGRAIYQEQMRNFEECIQSGEWPGLSGGGSEIGEVDIPEWEWQRIWNKPTTLQIGSEKLVA